MNNKIIILVLIFISFKINAQNKEIGFFVGYSNLMSDIGHNDPFTPFERNFKASYNPALGIFYKKVVNPKMLYKVSLSYANIPSNDLNSNRLDRRARGFSTNSELYEGSLTLEYNFFNIYDGLYNSTPYIFAGLGGFLHRNSHEYNLTFSRNLDASGSPLTPTGANDYLTLENEKTIEKPNLVIPFGLGYKFRIKEKFILGLEYGFRLTFYDNFDKSSPKNVNNIGIEPGLLSANPSLENDIRNSINNKISSYKKGNKNNNDYYSYTGITFSYLFGEPPCYCK